MKLRTRILLGGLAAFVAATSLGVVPVGAQRAPNLSFGVVARADAMAVEVRNTSFPLVTDGIVAFASPATSQALISSAGESRAFASAPYAGDLIVNLPGTVNGLAGGGFPPLPSYPLIARSNHPLDPAEDEVVGPYGISATSDANQSTGEARIGVVTGTTDLLASHSTASASIDADTGTVTGRAATRIEGFSVGPLLRLGTISASATLTRAPDGDLEPTTQFSVGTITIAGIELGLTSDGLQLGSNAIPLGGVDALLDQLSATGLGLRYLPSETSANGIISAGLELSYSLPVPGLGPVTVVLTLGRVSATAQVTTIGTAPAPPNVGADSAPTVATSGGGLDLGSPVITDTGAVERPSQPVAPIPASAGTELRLGGIYLAVVLAAVALLGGSRTFSLIGIGGHMRPDPRLIPTPRHVLDLTEP